MGFKNLTSKLSGKRKLLVIAVILLAVAASAATVIILSGSGKTARKAYLEAESKNIKKYTLQIKNAVNNMRENVKAYNGEPFKRRTEFTAGIISGDKKPFGMKNAEELFDVIARCKLVTDISCNYTDKKSVSKASLLYDKSPLIDAELFSDGTNLIFTVPEILPERYFGTEKVNMDRVYDRFAIPVRPKKVISFNNIANSIEFDEKLFDKSIAGYGTFISGMISEDDVKYGKNVKIDISGKKINCKEVLAAFDGEETKQLINGLVERITADDDLLNMTFGNAAGISGLAGDAGFFSLLDFFEKSELVVFNDTEKKIISALNIKNDIESFKNKLSELLNNIEFPEGLKMKLSIDRTGSILKREIILPAKRKGNEKGFIIKINSGSKSLVNNDFRNLFVNIDVSGDNIFELDFETALQPGKEKGDINGNIRFNYAEYRAGTLKSRLDAKIDVDNALDKLTLKRHTWVNYDFELDGSNPADKGQFSGEINTSSWSNKKFNTRNSNSGITLKLDMPSFDAGDFTLKLNFVREDKLGVEDFKLPVVELDSIVYLDKAGNKELNKLENDVLAAFGTFYMTNKPVIDAVTGTK